ncbi:MAG: hypothetical protein Q8Q23_05320 [bacterium]|nr:hypothetical protein [bacterium]
MKKIEQVVSIFPEVEGTVITELLEIIEANEFGDIDLAIEAGETVVGEMNTLEKAAYTCNQTIASKVEKILFKAIAGRERMTAEDCEKLKAFERKSSCLKSLMWSSINTRFGSEVKGECHGLGIRDGFQVVTLSQKEDEESSCSPRVLSIMVGM